MPHGLPSGSPTFETEEASPVVPGAAAGCPRFQRRCGAVRAAPSSGPGGSRAPRCESRGTGNGRTVGGFQVPRCHGRRKATMLIPMGETGSSRTAGLHTNGDGPSSGSTARHGVRLTAPPRTKGGVTMSMGGPGPWRHGAGWFGPRTMDPVKDAVERNASSRPSRKTIRLPESDGRTSPSAEGGEDVPPPRVEETMYARTPGTDGG